MLNRKQSVLFFILLFLSTSVFAMTESVQQATHRWGNALSSGNPHHIASLYDKNAFLYATFTNNLHGPDQITAYFTNLMKKKDLQVKFTEEHIRVFKDAAVNSGLYVFSFDDNGKIVKVPARYTFVFDKEPQGWVIVDHHSSVLPEQK